jgi:peptide/nickel transport system ATP-binding protein
MSALLTVRNLHIEAVGLDRSRHAIVNGLSFDVEPGEVVALVGESGSGKSMTALSLLQLLPAGVRIGDGSIVLEQQELIGRSERELTALRGRSMGMVFQEPMTALNPVFSIGDQIREVLKRHRGMHRAEAEEAALGLLSRVAIPDPVRCLRAYPHELSGGMRQRVVTAIAVAGAPRLLIADEPTTALDVGTQALLLDLLTGFARTDGMGLLLITHDLSLVAEHADRICVLFRGHLCETGPVSEVLEHPEHPYTRGLLACTPRLEGTDRSLATMVDSVPDPASEQVVTSGGTQAAWWPDLPGTHRLEPVREGHQVAVRVS